jgi:hypothetical protein
MLLAPSGPDVPRIIRGLGVVPDSALGRLFRDVAGWAHQRLAPESHSPATRGARP